MELGLVGLGKMGGNMRERIRRAGHTVIGYDRNPDLADVHSLEELVGKLKGPRVVWVMVPAGAADPVHRSTSWPSCCRPATSSSTAATPAGRTTRSTPRSWRAKGIGFVDCGVSGGVWGLENGYALMYGGDKDDVAAATSWTRTMRAPRCDREHGGDDAGRLEPRLLGRRSPGRRLRRHAGEARQRRLARPADEQRHAEREQRFLARQQLEVLRRRLAEADARIDDDALAPDPRRLRRRDALAQERRDLADDVVVARLGAASIAACRACASGRRRSRRAPRPARAPGRAQRTDVVDDVDAEVERARMTSALVVSIETGQPRRDRRLEHRATRASSSSASPARHRAGSTRRRCRGCRRLRRASARSGRSRAPASRRRRLRRTSRA